MPDANRVDQLFAFSQGELGDRETVELFADLVRTGLAWRLPGFYGRAAGRMIDSGIIDQGGNIDMEQLNKLAS